MQSQKNGPRVVMLLENNPYPFDPRVWPHAEALANAGYRMSVIAPRGKNERRFEILNGVRVYRFPMPDIGAGKLSYLVEFFYATLVMAMLTLWIWMRHGLDVVHMYNPPDTLWVAALLPKLFGKKVVFDLRDLAPEIYESKFGKATGVLYRILLWLERRICRISNHVILVNESYRKMVITRDGVKPENTSVVRQGPDLNRIHLADPDPQLRAKARTIIAYLGKMATQDGVDHLLRALHHLDKDLGYKDFYCVLIGKADDMQGLKRLAAELGLAERTWFTGYVPDEDMVRYLNTADICCDPDPFNPLNNISTMNKMMDYMALKKPTVAYDLIEHKVTGGDAALYAKPNDELDMARQFARLIDDPELCARLGEIGRERIEQMWAWPFQRERLLETYNKLTSWNGVEGQEAIKLKST